MGEYVHPALTHPVSCVGHRMSCLRMFTDVLNEEEVDTHLDQRLGPVLVDLEFLVPWNEVHDGLWYGFIHCTGANW